MMKKFLPFLLIAISCGSKNDTSKGDSEFGRTLLRKAMDIVVKDRQGKSYLEDYPVTYSEVEGTLHLEVLKDKHIDFQSQNFDFYFKLLTDTAAWIEAQYSSVNRYGTKGEEQYTILMRNSPDGWTDMTAGDYLYGVIDKEIDLDGNGINEFIMNNQGMYYLAFRNAQMDYESVRDPIFGSNGGEQELQLTYQQLDNGTIVESTVTSSKDGPLAKGRFRWDGSKLTLEIVRQAKPRATTNLNIDTLGTKQQVWESFQRVNKGECTTQLDESSFFAEYSEDDNGRCEYAETPNNFSRHYYNMDGFIEDQFSQRPTEIRELMFINVKHTVGAASMCYSNETIAAYYKNYWHLSEGQTSRLAGTVDTVYRLPNESALLINRTILDCLMWKTLGFTVYFLDKNGEPVFSQVQDLIKIEVNSQHPDGEMFSDSVAVQYQFDQSPITVTVSEFKRKQNGETSERVNTETKEYVWDDETRKFIVRQ